MAAQQNGGVESQGNSEEVRKEVNSKCTKVCGQQCGGKSCSKICLANVYINGQPEVKIRAYIVINDQSNCSLAKSELFYKLNVQGETFTYTLQTCASQSEVEGRRARSVVVESLDGVQIIFPPVCGRM